jgi:hypothetical protein
MTMCLQGILCWVLSSRKPTRYQAICATLMQAAVRAAAALLAFSSCFHDDKERVLLDAGVRFAATGVKANIMSAMLHTELGTQRSAAVQR